MVPLRRRNILTRVLVVGMSVLLFACGAESPEPDEASLARPVAPPLQPAPPADAARPMTGPQDVHVDSVVPPGQVLPAVPMESVETAPPAPAQPARMETRRKSNQPFTNKDLEKYRDVKQQFGFRDDVVTVDLTRKPELPDKAGPVLSQEERNKELEGIRAEINALTADLDYLKKRVPSLHNPYLARVPLSPDDDAAEAGMGNDERLDRVKERIARDESRLSELRRRLAEIHNMTPASGPTE